MTEDNPSEPVSGPGSSRWSEENSQAFIDFGSYFVPDRERQIDMIASLIVPPAHPFHILELACGEGSLAGIILERYPQAVVHGLDGSPKMLSRALANLSGYGERFTAQRFDLASSAWRKPVYPLLAVVSSLALHHLDSEQKQSLFNDVYAMLETGGAFIIADLIEPADGAGREAAARTWDEAVQENAVALDGSLAAFEVFRKEHWNLYRYPDPDMDKPSGLFDQLKWLEAAGFQLVDVYWMRAGHVIFGGRK